MMRRAALGLILMMAASGCASNTVRTVSAPGGSEKILPIFMAADALTAKWRQLKVWGKSEWRLTTVDEKIVIEPEVDGSSSALMRYVDIDTELCPVAEWSWRVDQLPVTADLASREAEDVAASIFFAFGDPGSLTNPDKVPTIRYVWSTKDNPKDQIVESPYFPEFLRSIVVRSGPTGTGAWTVERRNLREDFEAAFGSPPDEKVQVIALFTDNDHLRHPTKALYYWARARCSELPDPFWAS